jgi:hypothetical protein
MITILKEKLKKGEKKVEKLIFSERFLGRPLNKVGIKGILIN